MNYHRLLYESVIFGGLAFGIITLAAEWMYGSLTWQENNLLIRGTETILFAWAIAYWTIRNFSEKHDVP
jgi:hypothetical protein